MDYHYDDVKLLSIAGAEWSLSEVDIRDILTLKQKFGLSEIIARSLLARKVDLEQIFDFLHPTLKTLLPNPFHLLDMDKAITRIWQALCNKEKIVVFGDYDVDGATSSALIKRYFSKIGVCVYIYIPDRIEEGYGPNKHALLKLREEGYTLCITVDCGTLAHDPISVANSVGLDVIVIDHHLGINKLPEAIAVVNPNRLDESSACVNMAAVGVTFLVAVGLNKFLREKNFFNSHLVEPNLIDFLDLVALGTVCDIMKIDLLNRVFVAQGLKVMSARKNLGLRVLSDLIGIEEKLDTYHLGFVIGPHINSGGRVGNSRLGSILLSTTDEQEAIDIAKELQELNLSRKEEENKALKEAYQQALLQVDDGKNIILVKGRWHAGIIGIVASKLKDKFYLPSIVLSINNSDIAKASARSVSCVDLGSIVLLAKLKNLIIEGGGHAMAAGFSVYINKIDELYNFFLQKLADINVVKKILFDSFITVNAINLNLWKELQMLQPFGNGNSEPRFVIKRAIIKSSCVVGDSHIRCFIYDDNNYVKGICFNCVGTEIGIRLLRNNMKLMLLGKINVNYWKGNEVIQFIIEDVREIY